MKKVVKNPMFRMTKADNRLDGHNLIANDCPPDEDVVPVML